jgi:hypothetical protein
MQFSDIGRCTAASTPRSSAQAFCAKAVAKAPSGSQIKPLLSGASLGAGAPSRDCPAKLEIAPIAHAEALSKAQLSELDMRRVEEEKDQSRRADKVIKNMLPRTAH